LRQEAKKYFQIDGQIQIKKTEREGSGTDRRKKGTRNGEREMGEV